MDNGNGYSMDFEGIAEQLVDYAKSAFDRLKHLPWFIALRRLRKSAEEKESTEDAAKDSLEDIRQDISEDRVSLAARLSALEVVLFSEYGFNDDIERVRRRIDMLSLCLDDHGTLPDVSKECIPEGSAASTYVMWHKGYYGEIESIKKILEDCLKRRSQ